MSRYQLLNNIHHKNLRIITRRSQALGDDLMYSLTFPQEFRNIQGIYPIFFAKDSNNGTLLPVAMFGLRVKENLFLDQDGWHAPYIPLSIRRHPFLIGFQNTQEDGAIRREMVIHLDTESPRLSQTEGEPVFLPHAGNSDFLQQMAGLLDLMNEGIHTNEHFVATLIKHDLLESFTLDITLKNGTTNQLLGFHTINEEKLRALGEAVIIELHKKGFLEAIYMVIASMTQVGRLVELVQQRLDRES